VIERTGDLGRDAASYAAVAWPAALRRAGRLSPGFDS